MKMDLLLLRESSSGPHRDAKTVSAVIALVVLSANPTVGNNDARAFFAPTASHDVGPIIRGNGARFARDCTKWQG